MIAHGFAARHHIGQPFIVSIPHKLGKDEAIRRLKAGLGSVRSEYGKILQVHEEIWSGDRLAFRLTALKQQVSGTVDVAEDHVRLEVTLPWLLAGWPTASRPQSVPARRGCLKRNSPGEKIPS
jgi:hypothetical protein